MPPGFSLDHAPPPCSAEDIALPPYSTEEVTLLFCSTEDIAPLPCFAVCPLWLHLGLHGGRCSTFVLCLGCCAPPLGEQIAPHWCLVRGIMSPVSSAVGGAPKNPDQLGDVLSCTQEPPLEVAHKWGGGGDFCHGYAKIGIELHYRSASTHHMTMSHVPLISHTCSC